MLDKPKVDEGTSNNGDVHIKSDLSVFYFDTSRAVQKSNHNNASTSTYKIGKFNSSFKSNLKHDGLGTVY